MNAIGASAGLIQMLAILLYLGLLGLCIYCLILFIKLARRGIEALDIHLDEKRNKRDRPPVQDGE